MKPCRKNRERIAWLAMDGLETEHEPELRAHLDSCAGCRRYLEELSGVAGKLRSAEPQQGGQSSASFHRRVVGALANLENRSPAQTILAQLGSRWNWRMALPAAAAVALLMAAWWVVAPRADLPVPAHFARQTVAAPAPNADLAPTFANYEMAAHQSLDKLDELLTEQANRNPPSPVDTTTLNSRLNTAD